MGYFNQGELSHARGVNDVHSAAIAQGNPDSKVHGANMGPIWVLSAQDGPHIGPMNLAIRMITAKYGM